MLRTTLLILTLGSILLLVAACQPADLPAAPSPGSVEVVPTTSPTEPPAETAPAATDAPAATEAPAATDVPVATVAITPTLGVGPASTPEAVATTAPAEPVALPAGDLPEAVIAAQQALADELDMDLDAVTVVSYEWMEWSDSCLGAGRPDEMCATVITPGYKVMLEADDVSHQYHTNLDGSYWREVKGRF